MKVRQLKDRFLALPWVYDVLRPLAVGGIDLSTQAKFCDVLPDDRVFDLGCGTGRLTEHLRCNRYLGADLDLRALARASRYANDRVQFHCGDSWDGAFQELAPHVVLMIGVVHHLSDEAFQSILDRLLRVPTPPQRLVTLDVSYFPRKPLNNLFSRLDRGGFVRRPEEYEELFSRCGLLITRRGLVETSLGYVRYIGYHLAPQPSGPKSDQRDFE